METALSFYRGLLGLDASRKRSMNEVQGDIVGVSGVDGTITFLDAGGFEIGLIAYEAPENGYIHEESAGHDVGVATSVSSRRRLGDVRAVSRRGVRRRGIKDRR